MPLYICTTFCSSTPLLIYTWLLCFLVTVYNDAMNTDIQNFGSHFQFWVYTQKRNHLIILLTEKLISSQPKVK